jgi:hypothetical protein
MKDKQIVWLTVGAPGCGKTTFAKVLVEGDANIVRLCPDEFRAMYGWGEGDQSVSGIAFEATKKALGKALDEGHNAIIDATFMHRKARKPFINLAKGRGAQVIAMVFECTKNTLLERIKKRVAGGGRNIPESVVDTMLEKYQVPDEAEGFDKVTFVCKIKV